MLAGCTSGKIGECGPEAVSDPPCTEPRTRGPSEISPRYCFNAWTKGCEDDPVASRLRVSVDSFVLYGSSIPTSPRRALDGDAVRTSLHRAVDTLNTLSLGLAAAAPAVPLQLRYADADEISAAEVQVLPDGRSAVGMLSPAAVRVFFGTKSATAATVCYDVDRSPGLEECDIVFVSARRGGIGLPRGTFVPRLVRPDEDVYLPWATDIFPKCVDDPRGVLLYCEYSLHSTFLHELGHLLGLTHTSMSGSMMVEELQAGDILTPNCDDERALMFLYCEGVGEVPCDDDVVANFWCPGRP